MTAADVISQKSYQFFHRGGGGGEAALGSILEQRCLISTNQSNPLSSKQGALQVQLGAKAKASSTTNSNSIINVSIPVDKEPHKQISIKNLHLFKCSIGMGRVFSCQAPLKLLPTCFISNEYDIHQSYL